jgi:hypothetical protein
MPAGVSGNTFNVDIGMTAFNGVAMTGACPERSRREPFGNTTVSGASSTNPLQFTRRQTTARNRRNKATWRNVRDEQ